MRSLALRTIMYSSPIIPAVVAPTISQVARLEAESTRQEPVGFLVELPGCDDFVSPLPVNRGVDLQQRIVSIVSPACSSSGEYTTSEVTVPAKAASMSSDGIFFPISDLSVLYASLPSRSHILMPCTRSARPVLIRRRSSDLVLASDSAVRPSANSCTWGARKSFYVQSAGVGTGLHVAGRDAGAHPLAEDCHRAADDDRGRGLELRLGTEAVPITHRGPSAAFFGLKADHFSAIGPPVSPVFRGDIRRDQHSRF